MLVGKAVHALQFHDDLLLDHQIGHILADVLPFVTNWK
jgi:hypothetical protein